MQKELINYLSKLVTTERLSLFEKVLKNRTTYITIVLEDIFQAQNASATLRTCDCFGVQNVHVIENRNKLVVDSQVALGSSKWLSLIKHSEKEDNTLNTIKKLRKEGYRIIGTSPHQNDVDLEDFDLSKGKCALIFGSEQPGISDIIRQEADEFLKIPMVGFTESFNISVSVAIILHHLTHKMRNSKNIPWRLTENEKDEIQLEWLRNTIKKSKVIENEFLKNQ